MTTPLSGRFLRSLAVLEGTWTSLSPRPDANMIAYGTEGTMVAGRGDVRIYTTRSYYALEPDRVIEAEPLPEGRATLAEEFIHHLETGEPLHPTLQLDFNLEAMAILDAGVRSLPAANWRRLTTPRGVLGRQAMDEVRAAVVGLGIGRANGRSLQKNPRCRVTAICDIIESKMDDYADRISGTRQEVCRLPRAL